MEGMFAAFFINHRIEPELAHAVAARLVEEGAAQPALSSPFADEPSMVWDFATAHRAPATCTNIAGACSPAGRICTRAGFDNLADLPSLTEEELKELGFEKMRPRKLAVRQSPRVPACARLTPRSSGSWPR